MISNDPDSTSQPGLVGHGIKPPGASLTREEVLASMSDVELDDIIGRLGRETWVVMNKAGTSVVQNPGTGQPFSTKIKQRAEQVALEVGGVAITFNEAFKQLTKPH